MKLTQRQRARTARELPPKNLARSSFVGIARVTSKPTERFHAVARQVNPSKAAAHQSGVRASGP